jgi:hypothetical protein
MGRPLGSPNKEKESETTVQEPESKIQFFSEIDMNEKGSITSTLPAWYFDAHIEELKEAIGRKERALERGYVDQDQIFRVREELKLERKQLKGIEDSKPKLEGRNKDRCWNAYKSLQEQIASTLPTRKENLDGLVSPQNELKRMKSKHIKIDPEIAKACGVNVVKGHISGDEANKCYQILGKALGENTYAEKLRRDGNTEAYRSMNELTQSILKGIEARGS